ncbi:hypothetical protein [Pantoea agglomerans]|uniref:hypothetical protein n=1 Tax=Enterobacter agglomerans TaxID=549 RepID=UPI0039B728FD
MKYKHTLALFLIAVTLSPLMALADSQCGPFHLGTSSENDGWARINGAKPTSQKVTFLKQQGDYDNIQMQWMVPRTDYPGYYGIDYIKSNGKAILNVETIRSNMNEPRMLGSFDCVRIK